MAKMFGYPAPASTSPPSPIEPPRQNDYREIGVPPEAERATWRERRSAIAPATSLAAQRDAASDEWAPITIPVGALGIVDPVQLLGDDPERRIAKLLNIGTETLLLAPARGMLNGILPGATCFVLPAAVQISITTTRALYVISSGAGTAAGISAFIERGARDR